MTEFRIGTPRSRLAKSVVQYLEKSVNYTFAKIVAYRRDDGMDILCIDLEIEVVQRRKIQILPYEPISIIFMTNDDSMAPAVMSRREDFPVGHVHTNLHREIDGLCLCIWEESWTDLSSTLTGQELIERIRSWFSNMADGTLHDPEQPLEPLIPSTSNTLVLPANDVTGPWHIAYANKVGQQVALIMSREPAQSGNVAMEFAVFHEQMPPQVHRALASTPRNLKDLQSLCLEFKYDLVMNIGTWLKLQEQMNGATKRSALLIIEIPMQREIDSEFESVEVWAFTVGGKIAELGERLGATLTEKEHTTINVLGAMGIPNLGAIPLDRWRIVHRLDRHLARKFAGVQVAHDVNFLGIGAGAIGSNVAMIATRSGIGPWTIIDDDILLPHNTVRQVQLNNGVGFSKSQVLAIELDKVFSDVGNRGIVANLLFPGEEIDNINSALQQARLAVDFSASPAVVGWLADQLLAPTASFFFGPDGCDLVLMSEGTERTVSLDEIEAQYFLSVACNPLLKGHFDAARSDKIRYANACQDLSRPLPPWQVTTLCGLAAGRLPEIIESKHASACVWRLDAASGTISSVPLAVYKTHRLSSEAMRLTVSHEVINTMRKLRASADGDETGGVLVGTFDLTRNIIHIVLALPAPIDSSQSPTYFIRGVRHLKPVIEQLANSAAGRLHYIGEWHSHPDNVAARPSPDDELVYAHLNKHLNPAGSPYVMAICGQKDLWLRAGWQERGILEGAVEHDV